MGVIIVSHAPPPSRSAQRIGKVSNISEKQRDLLTGVRQPRRRHPLELAHALQVFLREKSPSEPLDPQWIGIWRTLREGAVDYLNPAGLKEIDSAISGIEPIDREVWDLRTPDDDQIVILLGAGASAPEPSNIPVVGNLLPELWRRARKIGRDELDRLASWCNSRGIRNIEDLLTAAYIANFAAKNGSVSALLDYFLFARGSRTESEEEYVRPGWRRTNSPEIDASSIALLQDTLQTLFGLLTSTMIPAKPNAAHSAITKLLKARPKTRIVTTNYDGCMDEALLAEGLSLDGIAGTGPRASMLQECPLIKMHGSINWSYCDSCQDVRDFSLPVLKRAFEEDLLSYAVIGVCKTCGGQRRPLLVPPLSFKFMMFPNLIAIWNQAQRWIQLARIIMVVGYSFSEADTYITKMVSRSLAMNAEQRLVVFDTNASLVPLMRERMSAHIEGFDDRRIVQVAGSCEETVPNVIESLLGLRRPELSGEAQTAGAPG